MKLLVTAGNTQTPIDRVRCMTNIFSGSTGAQIATHAFDRGHEVSLLTSHPDAADSMMSSRSRDYPSWRIETYRTFDDLECLMEREIMTGGYDAVIAAAAVSDYRVAGMYAPAQETRFDPNGMTWSCERGRPQVVDVSADKIKSDHDELWIRLEPTPKLVDRIRTTWRFAGVLVKFKLEVGAAEERLLTIAEASRLHSGADLMVANTLDGMHDWAYIGPFNSAYNRVPREALPRELVQSMEESIASLMTNATG